MTFATARFVRAGLDTDMHRVARAPHREDGQGGCPVAHGMTVPPAAERMRRATGVR